MPTAESKPQRFLSKKAVFTCSVVCVLCAYGWITREVSLGVWVAARLFETNYFRTTFNPQYFSEEPDETPEDAMRSRKIEAAKLMGKGPRMLAGDMAEVHDATIAVKGGEVPLRIYVPHVATEASRARAYKGVLVWMHGGGWLFGTVDAHDAMSRDMAEASRMIVVSVGYRLSPEVRFPEPLKDCLASIKWVNENIWAFGGDKNRIALVGESSGGNLAMATAIEMSKSWIPFMSRKSKLCALVAASPPLSYNHAKEGPGGGGENDWGWRSYKRYATGYGLEAGQMKGYWDSYLRNEKDGQNPLAAPLRAKRWMLKGLPPVLLMRAEHEVLWDEIFEMGRNIADAGPEVEEYQAKACIHGLFAKTAGSCGSDSLQRTAEFLQEKCS